MSDKRFALLIDSDNISAKYIDSILDEMTRHGVATYFAIRQGKMRRIRH